jgi:HSP20 family molecular chaperone IbpA
MDGSVDISKLSSLLAESSKLSENISTEKTTQPPSQANPTVVRTFAKSEENAKKSDPSKSIWADNEVASEDSFVDLSDSRPSPRYEYSYKQSVGTEDTILGMTDKTPLTSDCTHLVVKIHFPGCSMKDIDLKVTSQRITAQSKTLKLQTYMPVKVDDSNGNAKFDPKKEILIVTLPIIHEL